VEVVGPENGRNGVICSLVSADGARSMAADRSAAAALEADEIEAAWLEGCEHLFVSGYALLREPARSAAARAAELARAEGAAVSVDLSTWSALRDAGAESVRDSVHALRPDVVFANEDEARSVGGPWPGPIWVVKRGPRGASFGGEEREAQPVAEVVDSTGAGDALAAGFIVGGADLALDAAARCVSRLGSLP
jgi:sugar/nucleoside kinase (ribokinase family)